MPDSQPAPTPTYNDSVFINCPFDEDYQPLFDAAVFTVYECGFFPRCSLEKSDGGESRIEKIIRLLKACRYSIHDISRTQLDPTSNLPRFNMPLELGIDLGLRHSGQKDWSNKSCIVLDSERYRFHKFISDIGGQDPHAHDNDAAKVIRQIRDWLRTETGTDSLRSASAIRQRYELFRKELPEIADNTPRDEMTFADFATFVSVWIKKAKPSPIVTPQK